MAPGCNGNPELPGCRRFDSAPTDIRSFFFEIFFFPSLFSTESVHYYSYDGSFCGEKGRRVLRRRDLEEKKTN